MTEQAFEQANVFGKGQLNTGFAQYFIGNSYLNPLTEPGKCPVFLANVTFEPGCRNNWHIHHAKTGGGQLLICTAGSGWYQEEGKEPVTAIAYQSGTSEQYVGRAVRDFAKREDVVVATKFLPRTGDEIAAGVSGQQHIEQMLDKSLENLGIDYVDLYICHMWDYQTPLYEIMEGLNNMVKAGKARYIGISNCFAWQLAKANALAEKEGFPKFVSIQGHYNLIFREEEREMAKLCAEDNIAMTPYSALAGGRLSKHPGETSKRLEEDSYAKLKYDATAEQDSEIIRRVAELADKHGITMTEISLAWLLTKVTAPVVGATKLHHIEGAAKAVDLTLTAEELAYLEEPYVPHALVGVMAQNTSDAAKKPHVWSTGNQEIK